MGKPVRSFCAPQPSPRIPLRENNGGVEIQHNAGAIDDILQAPLKRLHVGLTVSRGERPRTLEVRLEILAANEGPTISEIQLFAPKKKDG